MVRTAWRLAGLAVVLAAGVVAAADIPPAERRSGFDFMSPQTQAMQKDDTANPGMLWVLDGERLWRQPEGSAGAACARCHGDDAASLRGVATRYPAFDAGSERPIDLAGRINLCRTSHQGAAPLALESQELLALTAFVAHQSRGMPVAPAEDLRLTPFRDRGQELYERRIGQLDLSCAACHDDNWGKRLGGSQVPQGHPTAYPLYRLEWQGVGSLQRRVRGCMVGVRAEPFASDAREWVELELYLMSRAAGLPIETPGVRP
jgi:sulfur-oxidizing protein SoxA